MPSTFVRPAPGRGGHCDHRPRGRTVLARRSATTTGTLEASATDHRSNARLDRMVKTDRSRSKVTSRVTKAGIRPRARVSLTPAGIIRSARRTFAAHRSPPAPCERRSSMFSATGHGSLATNDPSTIEVGLQCSRRGHEFRVVRDGPRKPVDVARLEGRDLTERVAVELAEVDRMCPSLFDRRQRGGSIARIPAARRAARWAGTPWGLSIDAFAAKRRSGRGGEPAGPDRLSRARNVPDVSRRPVTGRDGRAGGGPERRAEPWFQRRSFPRLGARP